MGWLWRETENPPQLLSVFRGGSQQALKVSEVAAFPNLESWAMLLFGQEI